MSYLGRNPTKSPLVTSDIPDNSITAAKIVADTIAAGDIADDAVGTAALANDVVINTSGAITTTGAFTSVGIDDNASGATAMTIDASENIGIGTSSPDCPLNIEGTAAEPVVRIKSMSSTHNGYLSLQNDQGDDWNIGTVRSGHALDGILLISGGANVAFNTTGNVGIGTTTPTATLGIETTGNSLCTRIVNTHVDFSTGVVHLVGVRAATDSYKFLECYSGNGNDDEARLTGAGTLGIDGALTQNGVDYAEYFESKTGNAIAVGTTVKLDGNKVVACSEGDTPIGVVRPRGVSSTVGGCSWNKWNQKHLRDDYDAYIKEEYTQTEWEDGLDEDVHPNIVSYQTDMIPADKTAPADAMVISEDEDGNKLMRRKLNPDYDESQTYIPREERDEWVIVGLLGQIPITKGQPLADSWIKMKDVSETVEMWFVK